MAAGLACAMGGLMAAAAAADVNLELRVTDPSVGVGELVSVGLYAVSDSEVSQLVSAIQMVLAWDPAHLDLMGINQAGAVPLLLSYFPPNDVFGLNETTPPQDGDGFYAALGQLGNPLPATPAGTLITTFQFQALADTASTSVEIQPSGGKPATETVVFSGVVPNLDITGDLIGAKVVIGAPCLGDVNEDGTVNVEDLVAVILAWGSANAAADVDDNGTVDVQDMVAVILAWGDCP
jgi:hypothetical protein